MKLNKVLALALSGVMAVSMLAGCSGNPADGEQGNNQGDTTVDTSVASVLNDEQADTDNKVKVDFTYSNSLETALKKTLDVTGVVKANAAETYLKNVLQVEDVTVGNFYGSQGQQSGSNKEGKQTAVFIYRYNNGLTDTGIAKDVYNKYLDSALEKLTENYTKSNVKWSYSYTGEVAMSKVEKDNQTYTYIAFVMTCNTTKALAD